MVYMLIYLCLLSLFSILYQLVTACVYVSSQQVKYIFYNLVGCNSSVSSYLYIHVNTYNLRVDVCRLNCVQEPNNYITSALRQQTPINVSMDFKMHIIYVLLKLFRKAPRHKMF